MEKVYDKEEALNRIRKYCAYRERCHKEVDEKLFSWGYNQIEAGEIISKLIQENFLNEERYARAFARGKFRMNKWGRNKIRQGLMAKDINDRLIQIAFNEIDENDYAESLSKLLLKKEKSIREKNDFIKRRKLAEYVIRKGYEPELVWEIVKKDY